MKDREEYISILEQDNAKLKKQAENYKKLGFKHLQDQNVELNKKYENAVADYETTMAEKEQLNSLVNSCQEEIRQLKKQLEENKDKINWYENFEINKTIDKLRIKHNNQQKEFIEYLENEININPYNISDYAYEDIINTILSKYKSIIGDDK